MINIKRTAEDAAAGEDPDELYLAESCSECRRRRAGRTFRPRPSTLASDEAMAAIEVATPGLKGVLPKDHNRPALDG